MQSIRTYTGEIRICPACAQPCCLGHNGYVPAWEHFREQYKGIICELWWETGWEGIPIRWREGTLKQLKAQYPDLGYFGGGSKSPYVKGQKMGGDWVALQPPEKTYCVNGCTEPHNPLQRFPRCVKHPNSQRSEGRCKPGECISRERAYLRANPGLSLDMSDGSAMTCHHCGLGVCIACQTEPRDSSDLCDRCAAP